MNWLTNNAVFEAGRRSTCSPGEGNSDIACGVAASRTIWWQALDCGRQLLDFNAQAVEDLNKFEQFRLFADYFDLEMFPLLSNIVSGDEFGRDNDDNYIVGPANAYLRFSWAEYSRGVAFYINGVIKGDGAKAGMALLFTLVYMTFHTRDFGLTLMGLLHIIMSIPVSISLLSSPLPGLNIDEFGTLNSLGIFIILGIGADNIFIYMDCWKESDLYYDTRDLESRMVWTYTRASSSIFTTTVTTACAFFANGISPIPPIYCFGVFTGMLVMVDYVYVITWFPAMMILKERGSFFFYIPGYICCAPLATQGFHPAQKKKMSVEEAGELEDSMVGVKVMPNADDLKDNMGLIAKFFFSVYTPFMALFRVFIVAGYVAVLILCTYFALQLKVDENAPAFLPADDNFQHAINLQASNDAVFVNQEQIQFISMYAGLMPGEAGVDRSNVKFVNTADYGKPIFVPDWSKKLATAAAQNHLVKVCDTLLDKTKVTTCAGASFNGYDGNVATGHNIWKSLVRKVENSEGEVYCPIYGFRAWLKDVKKTKDGTAAGFPYTASDFPTVIAEYSSYVRDKEGISSLGQTSFAPQFGNTPLDTLCFDFSDKTLNPFPLVMYQMYFNATFAFNAPGSTMNPIVSDMDCFLKTLNDGAPDGMEMSHTGVKFTQTALENAFSTSALNGTLLSLSIAFVCIMIATGNWIMTLVSIVFIGTIVVAVIAFMVLIGWKLSVIESICITIVVGLSVDYTIHLGHIYIHSEQTERQGKVRELLSTMGVSVIAAAITTLGSATFLGLCRVQFFYKFGIFVFANITLSTIFAFFFFMALLMVAGPLNGQGQLWGTQGGMVEDGGPAEELEMTKPGDDE